ncbi:hypothetical protein FOA52_008483 [Chlamydomonas sp. UWO 241]|nr:hypothetical protein FOA52_008483 [Chlamydomonas sp. UWO 241]
MSDNEDDDEMAALRAARAARMGGGAGLADLRARQKRDQEAAAAASQFVESGSGAGASASGQRERAPPLPEARGGGADEDADEDDEDAPVVVGFVEEADLMHESLRSQLPMGFGQQEKKEVNLEEEHGKFKRGKPPPVGPPRPPAKVGPPRPPASGGAGGSGASGSFGPPQPPASGRGGGGSFGPPRPPAAGVGGVGDGDAEAGPARPPRGGEEEEEEEVGPQRPAGAEDEEEEEDDDDREFVGALDDDGGDPWLLPVTHEVALGGHTRTVSALDIDHTGSRLVTGGLDYMVRIYDFNGLKRDMRSFREIEPQDGHPVHALSWSPSGDAFLCVTVSSKAKIFDRDGIARGEFVRGDMYIRDMKNTKGHVSGLTGGQWHPLDKFTCITCSEDGTVRVWDTHNIMQKTVIKPTLQKPVRTPVSAVRYSGDGRIIAAGLNDGSIQLWSVTGKFGASAAIAQVMPPTPQMIEKQGWTYVSRPSHIARGAHTAGEEITSLQFTRDGNQLLSRGMDATMKLWDVRQLKSPVRAWGGLPCCAANTMATFSPDEQFLVLVLTGVQTGEAHDETGALLMFNKSTGELVRKLAIPGSVTAIQWQRKLNQIFVGSGTRKGGSTVALYDPGFSEKGVMIGAARQVRKPNPDDWQAPLLIREYDGTRKRRRGDVVVPPGKLRMPDPGSIKTGGKGIQGKIGTSSKTILTQHIMKQKGILADFHEEDAREMLLRHADTKDEFEGYLTGAYAKTQPAPVWAEEDEGEEEDA